MDWKEVNKMCAKCKRLWAQQEALEAKLAVLYRQHDEEDRKKRSLLVFTHLEWLRGMKDQGIWRTAVRNLRDPD